MSHISIYLTNLGKYNEGELLGEWVELPVNEDEFQEVLKRIGISNEPDPVTGQYYEEYFITDYETDIPGLSISEYDSITHLNELAESVDNLSDYDLKIFKNAVEAGFIDESDIADFDSSRFILYNDVSSLQDLGYAMVDDFDNLDKSTLEDNFDFDAYGREERLAFFAPDWLDVDYDDSEDVERVCEEYGVDDIDDIDAYIYFGVSDDEELGRYFAEDISNFSRDELERYFDYESYGRYIDSIITGAFTTDGYIEYDA